MVCVLYIRCHSLYILCIRIKQSYSFTITFLINQQIIIRLLLLCFCKDLIIGIRTYLSTENASKILSDYIVLHVSLNL